MNYAACTESSSPLQEWVKDLGGEDMHCLRGPRHCRQGRDHQGNHRTGQSKSLPSRRPSRTHCSGEVTDVHPAIPAPLPGCR